MQNKTRCVDVATEIINLATNRFKRFYSENQEYKRLFFVLCGLIDKVIDENDASEFRVFVNEEDLTIGISVTATTFEAFGANDPLYRVLKVANSFSCKNINDGDAVEILMIFPPIWEAN